MAAPVVMSKIIMGVKLFTEFLCLNVCIFRLNKFSKCLKRHQYVYVLSVLINQFVHPTFCLCFAFTDINFLDMLHHVCDVPMTKTCVDQSGLVNVGAQKLID